MLWLFSHFAILLERLVVELGDNGRMFGNRANGWNILPQPVY
jgi:hypothetical protein